MMMIAETATKDSAELLTEWTGSWMVALCPESESFTLDVAAELNRIRFSETSYLRTVVPKVQKEIRNKPKIVAAIPGYIPVCLPDPSHRIIVLGHRGIKSHDALYPRDNQEFARQLHQFNVATEDNPHAVIHHGKTVGTNVRVLYGPYKDFEAKVAKVDGDDSVIIEIFMLGRWLKAPISLREVEPI